MTFLFPMVERSVQRLAPESTPNCHRDSWRSDRCRTLLFLRRWISRRDRFAFGLFSVRLEIKHHEYTDHHEKRSDPFQEPAGITQNLHATLSEVFRAPRCLRNFIG